MGDICLFKNVSDGMEAETLVEGNGVGLGMEAEGTGSLTAGFGEEGVHKTRAEALMALGGEHATDAENGVVGNEFVFAGIERCFVFFAIKAGIGNDFGAACKEDMRSEVVNVIFVKVNDTLFLGEDGITGFEDLVEF